MYARLAPIKRSAKQTIRVTVQPKPSAILVSTKFAKTTPKDAAKLVIPEMVPLLPHRPKYAEI